MESKWFPNGLEMVLNGLKWFEMVLNGFGMVLKWFFRTFLHVRKHYLKNHFRSISDPFPQGPKNH